MFGIAQPLVFFCIKAVFQRSVNVSAFHNNCSAQSVRSSPLPLCTCSLFHIQWFSSRVTPFKFGVCFLFCLTPSCSLCPADLAPVPYPIFGSFSPGSQPWLLCSQPPGVQEGGGGGLWQPQMPGLHSHLSVWTFQGGAPALVLFQSPDDSSVQARWSNRVTQGSVSTSCLQAHSQAGFVFVLQVKYV